MCYPQCIIAESVPFFSPFCLYLCIYLDYVLRDLGHVNKLDIFRGKIAFRNQLPNLRLGPCLAMCLKLLQYEAERVNEKNVYFKSVLRLSCIESTPRKVYCGELGPSL